MDIGSVSDLAKICWDRFAGHCAQYLCVMVLSAHEYRGIPLIATAWPVLYYTMVSNLESTTMKLSSSPQSSVRLQVLAAAIGTLLIQPTLTMAAEDHEPLHESLIEKVRQLEDRMSNKFRNTWKELRDSGGRTARSEQVLSSASVDVREQNDGYTVRISLPGREIDKVEVGLINDNRLRIFAPANGKTGSYEQIVVLDGLAAGAKPDVTRRPKDDLIIIHLSKPPASGKPAAPEAATEPPKTLTAPLDRWDRDILARMERMRREMDDMFQQSIREFGDVPEFKGMFDRSRFGSSVDLQEENGNYVVRAYLPDRDAENIKVTVDEHHILKIEADAEERNEREGGTMVFERKSHYSQHLTLPGPVDAGQLKVDRKNGMLLITVPKKATS